MTAPRAHALRTGRAGSLSCKRDLAGCGRARRSRASAPAATAAKRRTSASRSFKPRSITDAVACCRSRVPPSPGGGSTPSAGSAAGRCAVAAQRSRSQVRVAERRHSFGCTRGRAIRGRAPIRPPPRSRRRSIESGAGSRSTSTASVAATCSARVVRQASERGGNLAPRLPMCPGSASCAARAEQQLLHLGDRRRCARHLRQRLAASARMPTPSFERRCHHRNHVRLFEPADRANAVRRPLPCSPTSPARDQLGVRTVSSADQDLLQRRGLRLRRWCGLRQAPSSTRAQGSAMVGQHAASARLKSGSREYSSICAVKSQGYEILTSMMTPSAVAHRLELRHHEPRVRRQVQVIDAGHHLVAQRRGRNARRRFRTAPSPPRSHLPT